VSFSIGFETKISCNVGVVNSLPMPKSNSDPKFDLLCLTNLENALFKMFIQVSGSIEHSLDSLLSESLLELEKRAEY
jgi:hypothetical protein